MDTAKENARLSLAQASYDPKKLALLHTGAAMLGSLLISLLSYFLDLGIAGTGGLNSIGFRAVLSSAQSLLRMALTLLLPFWELGFLFAALQFSRREQVGPSSLFEGFRRFFPALRLFVLQAVLFMGVFMACMYAAYAIFMCTPYFERTYAVLKPLMETTGELVPDKATVSAVLPTLVPMYVILGIVLLVFGAPMFYRYRMAQFALLDGAGGAFKAMALSTKIMRGRRISLFRVDLSFWWYYALQLLIAALSYGNEILAGLGVSLPVSSTVSFWLFYGSCLALQLLVAWQFSAWVQTSYAHCYDTYRQYAAPLPQPTDPTKNP